MRPDAASPTTAKVPAAPAPKALVKVPAQWTVLECPECSEPVHASEGDDTGRCASCRRCYWCDAEAVRMGIERDLDDNARTRETCDECGESCDRAEALRKREILRNDEPHV